jgi:cell division inhibitor SepF
MGFLNELKKLARPYDDDDDEFEDFTPKSTEKIPVTPKTAAQARSSYGGYEDVRDSNKVVNIHATAQLQVVLVKPERFENAAEIADHLREKRTVVLNLEHTNKEIARRLIDFLSGVAYAQDGKIKKVAVNTYIITPYNVDLMGDLIDELENNGLYF